MKTAALLVSTALLVACSSAQPEPAAPAGSGTAIAESAVPLASSYAGPGRLNTGDKGCPTTAPRHGDACSMRGHCSYGGDAAAASDPNGPRSCRCAGDLWECTGAP